jgi:hypothetical protein
MGSWLLIKRLQHWINHYLVSKLATKNNINIEYTYHTDSLDRRRSSTGLLDRWLKQKSGNLIQKYTSVFCPKPVIRAC